MQATAKVTRSGQISIPNEIRQAMSIEKGDLVTIDVIEIATKAKELGKGEVLDPVHA